jgi:hypothetical protein
MPLSDTKTLITQPLPPDIYFTCLGGDYLAYPQSSLTCLGDDLAGAVFNNRVSALIFTIKENWRFYLRIFRKVLGLSFAVLLCSVASSLAQTRYASDIIPSSFQSQATGADDSDASKGSSVQESAAPASPSPSSLPPRPAKAERGSDLGKVGIGVRVSTLGVGFQTGVALTHKLNVRGGASFFSYSRTFNYNGISYKGNLDFRNGDLLLDWFPFGKGFHLSGGALIYNGNKINASASAPAGQSFSLGSTTYFSGNTNPITGTGNLSFRKAAPEVLFGFGNLVPRTRHFSFVFDAGVAFAGIPQTKIALQGTACTDFAQTNCVNAATDPTVQSNIIAQQSKLSNKAKYAQYWPIVSMGFGYRF